MFQEHYLPFLGIHNRDRRGYTVSGPRASRNVTSSRPLDRAVYRADRYEREQHGERMSWHSPLCATLNRVTIFSSFDALPTRIPPFEVVSGGFE